MQLLKLKPKKRTLQTARTVKILEQSGKRISIDGDKKRKAQLPGKRISKSGKVYWETRKNRSDAPFKDI